MKEKAIIVGAGTYGQVYSEYLSVSYDVVGFIDDDISLLDKSINGISVLGNFEMLLSNEEFKSINIFVPIGNNKVRVNILNKLKTESFVTPSFIHPAASIPSSVILGNAVYVLEASHIMPFCQLDDFVMISIGVNISHHTHLSKGVFLSNGVNLGASIQVKEYSFFGMGSTIMTGVKEVGNNSIIGAGAVVIKDVPDGATVVGNPGRVIKINEIS